MIDKQHPRPPRPTPTPTPARRRPDALPTRVVMSALGVAASLGLVTVISPPTKPAAAVGNTDTAPDGQVAGAVGADPTQQSPGDSAAPGVTESAAPAAQPKGTPKPGKTAPKPVGGSATPKPTKKSSGAVAAAPRPPAGATAAPGGAAPAPTAAPIAAPTAPPVAAPTAPPAPAADRGTHAPAHSQADPGPDRGKRDAQALMVGSARRPAMGGSISAVLGGDACDALAARLLDRIAAWASFLTRHDPASDLSRLNADSRRETRVGPTLAAALHAASSARRLTGGIVDPAVLDARLAAETGGRPVPARDWMITGDTVTRERKARLDLSGVAKGWMAERALWLPRLLRLPVVLVECDGDIAIRSDGSIAFDIQIEDPRAPDPSTLEPIAVISLPLDRPVRIGVATSGTYRHSWDGRGHIVDPATGESASAGIVTATVVAPDAIAAEALAKVVVLRGAAAAPMLEAAGATAIALTDHDTQLRFAGIDQWLA